MNHLHLFYSSELIAKLSFSQNNILCNLCLFNIREFALKESVINNIILLNPSFLPCLSYCPTTFVFFFPLSFFLPCLSSGSSPSLPFLTPLFSMLVLLLSHSFLLFALLHTSIFLLSQTQKGLKTKEKLTKNEWRKTKRHLEEGH